ncbi:MAG TPA: hypothetical protein VFL96_05830, partial [Acidobacteriaceae bacterium]|nr:hypothetical protein [Acidobacteriaceae bacterium]
MKRIFFFALATLLALPLSLHAAEGGAAATTTTTTTHHRVRHHAHVKEKASVRNHVRHLQHSRKVANTRVVRHRTTRTRRVRTRVRRHRYYEHFDAVSFVSDPSDLTQGDITSGEDPMVR